MFQYQHARIEKIVNLKISNDTVWRHIKKQSKCLDILISKPIYFLFTEFQYLRTRKLLFLSEENKAIRLVFAIESLGNDLKNTFLTMKL
jgi:hypothetical protein